MQIRLKEDMTRDEALMLLEVANREVEMLNQRLAEQEETIEQLEDTNAALRGENAQQKLELEAIRALLAERDALRDALKKYASPDNWEYDEHGWARLWLEPDSTSRRSYDGTELARAALAQDQEIT